MSIVHVLTSGCTIAFIASWKLSLVMITISPILIVVTMISIKPLECDKISTKPSLDIILTGNIEFDNVYFSYPTRPDFEILHGMSFNVKRGETIALCGQSGSGKSTCIQLLLNLYEPTSGTIRIDRCPIQDYDVKRLRQQIGVVSQEPVGTIQWNTS
ncbi:unnamed protein product [Didymodactylos carnosus]|uniref:ABC transporter domain-containing protein n=1 Tax=Didymodactylos carnosus TaxID=1234261 RepID=A0A8S2FJ92_9BILA|nr:unnamed protein product [Didymodactylos carnosus]CAF4272155.1 unnamed protein product [Didymodactylos carnosus]